jgi:hypothetical protein
MPLASLLQQHRFESNTHLLTTAFDEAWAKVVASRSPIADESNAGAARSLLARWIIAVTHGGERDGARLIEDAMEYMATLKAPLPRP